MNNRVIITGATSMIGQALVEECLRQGREVCAIVRPDTTREDRLPEHEHLQVVYCTLDEVKTLPEKVEGKWDIFYHIAWAFTGSGRNKSVRLQTKNITYTLDAVEAAHQLGCSRFIGAGSQAEYGPKDLEKIGPEEPEAPTTAYGAAKLSAGKLSRILCEELGMEWIWPRIFSVYGQYDKESTMIMTALRQFLADEETAFTPAGQLWDYLYAKDAGRAFDLIGQEGIPGSVYCIGSGQCRPLRDYIYEIRDAVGSSKEPGIGKRQYPPHPVMRLCADIESLTRDTGFVPEYDFARGIREIITLRREALTADAGARIETI